MVRVIQQLADLRKNLDSVKKPAWPTFVNPQLATLVKAAPEGDNWLHEIKFDGYRIFCFCDRHKVKLLSRNEQDWTRKFQIIADSIKTLNLPKTILDGELIALDEKGISRFQLLQNALQFNKPIGLTYVVFDLLFHNGYDLRAAPLLERKKLLEEIFKDSVRSNLIKLSGYVIGHGESVYSHSCKLKLEGIISKRCSSPYQSVRNDNWLKIKCSKQQEFVVGGYTDPQGSRDYFGALLIGYYEGNKLIYCGKVGTGFNRKRLLTLFALLTNLRGEKNPFSNFSTSDPMVHWVKPKLVVEISFTELTHDKRLRHPSFQGIREDKKAKEVKLESPL